MRNITCIICPRGCAVTVDDNLTVSGNACKRGETYAIAECTNPTRTVTSIVRVENREDTMLSVKTEAPIPKGKMMDAMAQIRQTLVSAPVAIGDVIIDDLFGTKLIATGNVK